MYFDPLSSWLTVIIANGMVESSNYVSNSQMIQIRNDSVKRINGIVNGSILNIRKGGYISPEQALKDIKNHVEWAQNSYEMRHGYGKLEISRESYEFIVKLCEEYRSALWMEYGTYSRIYYDRINNGEPAESLSKLRQQIDTLEAKAKTYQSILDMSRKNRDKAAQHEQEIVQKIAESNSNGEVIMKSLTAIGMCIGALAIMMSGSFMLGAVALIGSAICGYYMLK